MSQLVERRADKQSITKVETDGIDTAMPTTPGI